MNNFEHATEATNTAISSQGSAIQENDRYMEGLTAKLTALKSTFQDFANNILSSDIVASLLDIANGFLKLANTDVGQFVSQIVLLTGLGWGSSSLLKATQIVPVAVKQFSNFFNLFKNGTKVVSDGAKVAKTGIAALSASTSAALPIILGLAAVAVVGKKIYDAWKEANPPLEEAIQNLEDTNTKLQENQARIEEINQLGWANKTPEILEEKEALEQENQVLQEQLDKLNKITEKQAKKIFEHGEVVDSGETGWSATLSSGKEVVGITGQGFDTYEELVQYLNDYIPNASSKTREELESLGVEFGKVNRQVILTGDDLVNHYVRQASDLTNKMSDSTLKFSDSQIKNVQAVSKYFDKQIEKQRALKESTEELEAIQKRYEQVNLGLLSDEELQSYQTTIDKLEEIIIAKKTLGEDTSDLEQREQDLIAAYNEAADRANAYDIQMDRVNGKLGLQNEQVESLVTKYPGLKNAIEQVNGVNYLNVDSMSAVVGATDKEQQAMYDTIAAMTVFNNTNLDVSQKISRLNELAMAAGVAADFINSINAADPTKMDTVISGLLSEGYTYEQAQSEYVKSIWNRYSPQISIKKDIIDSGKASGGAGGGSSSKKSPIEEANELWQDQLSLLEDRLEILQKSGAPQEQQLDQMKKIQIAIHNQAEKYRAMGLSNDDKYIRDLQKLWWNYQNDIKDVYDEIAKAAKEAAEEARKAWEDTLEQQKSDYETTASYVVDKIEAEIKNLQSLRDETEKYYDDKIQALKDSNEELDKQIEYEELLNKLAQAKDKKLYVFKDGQFQYVDDVDEIASAQADLDSYKRERALEEEVANLEKLKEEALANIDEQIDGWEKYKDEWSNVVQQYTDKQNQLIAEQVLGIDLEQKNWEKRLINAQDFANQYNNIMASLSTASQEGAILTIGGTSNMSPSDLSAIAQAKREYESATTKAEKDAAHAKAEAIRAKYGYSGGGDGSQYIPSTSSSSKSSSSKPSVSKPSTSKVISTAVSKTISAFKNALSKHADGTISASGGLSLVGEQGPELRVLGNGDGIIPANITRNLWDWGKINPSSIYSGNSQIFNIDNITLPNARDAESLVSGLKQLAYQRAYKRA